LRKFTGSIADTKRVLVGMDLKFKTEKEEQIFGMTEEEFIRAGRNGTVDLSDPRLKSALEERARTGKFKGELNYKRKDGTIFPGEVSTSFLKIKTQIV